MPSLRSAPAGGAFRRRFTEYGGLFYDEFSLDSAWLRETARIRLPPLVGCDALLLGGEYAPHPAARGLEAGPPGLVVKVNGRPAGRLREPVPGLWGVRVPLPPQAGERDTVLDLALTGTGWSNFLAWIGRVSRLGPLQRYRRQNKNRQLRIRTVSTDDGEIIYDFSQRDGPFSRAFARRHARLGLNIVGFLTADLGVGESARCMVRAADAAGLPSALVPLKLHCRNPLGDPTYSARLQEANPHGVNVIHVDPPAARDIDHHHGAGFRRGKYNVGYFAWELPEFPDAWLSSLDHFDEIWCPSEFVRMAIAPKSPLPVLTMPHAIAFDGPAAGSAELRASFGLPPDRFLFLTLFDLNSYSERKNPGAALEAFRRSGLGAGGGAGLVVKVHNVGANPGDLARLEAAAREIPGVVLLTETLSRTDIYALEAACDALISLHRSEGFGLVVAECMRLGKPAIATDWSATAEYLNGDNGCPVRSRPIVLDRSHGPYARGSTWAEPDPAHAAEYMRRLAGDPPLAERLGAAARATIEARFAPEIVGTLYRRRLEAIATF
ncbi:MAG: glycosyltransferase family 4 protein [Opitutaceae bacterium]